MLGKKNQLLSIMLSYFDFQVRVLAAFLCVLLALATSAEARPLKDLLFHLEQTHPALTEQFEQVRAAESRIGEAQAGFFPRVQIGGSYGYQEQDRQGGVSSNGERDADPMTTSFSVSQNVFEGFRTLGSIGQAEASTEATAFQYQTARQQIFLQAIQAYVNLIRQWHMVQLSQQNIRTLENQVAAERERMSAGTGIAVDVLFAQSRLQQAYDRYAGFLGEFHQSEAAFEQFFGMPPDYSNLRLPSLSLDALPEQMPQAVQLALMNSPELKQFELTAEAAANDKTVAQANYFPRVDVIASSNFNDSGDIITGEVTTNAIQVQGSWEIFSGFADRYREKRAIHNYQSSLAAIQNTQRRTIEATERSWAQLASLRQRAAILQNAVTTAQQVYAARKRLRDIGSETALNVLDAENELFNAQINAASTQYQSYLANFQLLQSIGMLDLESII